MELSARCDGWEIWSRLIGTATWQSWNKNFSLVCFAFVFLLVYSARIYRWAVSRYHLYNVDTIFCRWKIYLFWIQTHKKLCFVFDKIFACVINRKKAFYGFVFHFKWKLCLNLFEFSNLKCMIELILHQTLLSMLRIYYLFFASVFSLHEN